MAGPSTSGSRFAFWEAGAPNNRHTSCIFQASGGLIGREARKRLAEAVETAHSEAVVLERYGQPAAVLVSPERYEELMEALEDLEDVEAFDAVMAEEGPSIPWEQVKSDLGWV